MKVVKYTKSIVEVYVTIFSSSTYRKTTYRLIFERYDINTKHCIGYKNVQAV